MAIFEARESFWAYRQFLNSSSFFIRGWWQREMAHHLQQFFSDFQLGLRPILVLVAPPQHGKSVQIVDLISWILGQNPDLKAIYASFSDRLGVRANLCLQRTFDSPKFQKLFPTARINATNVVTISGQFLRNREMLEFIGREGSFRNTTVRGSVTGEGLDLGFLDDAIKGREEANSPTIRQKTWDWFTDDFYSRFSDKAALLILTTRWHMDDLVGRLEEHFEEQGREIRVLRYPALAEQDEPHRKKGQPLFPEHKSLDFLLTRKNLMSTAGWESVYQGSPIVVGGGLFPVESFGTASMSPSQDEIRRSVRYWDKAGTQGGGAYTAGVRMDWLKDGRFLVSDVVHAQLGALQREKMIKATAERDGKRVEVWVEQEPGSGGKESAERTIANLAGWVVKADRVTGDKETRAEPYAAQVQGGNILLLNRPWVKKFKDEHEHFPNGKYKDQVDAAAGAFSKLVSGSTYTLEYVR